MEDSNNKNVIIIYMKTIYKGKNFGKIEKNILKAFDFVRASFPVEISGITVCVYENRFLFNKKLKRETPEWLIANASGKEIDILSPLAIEKESNHKKNEFSQILKHEFTHLFLNKLAKRHIIPMWINEGIASYVARQHKNDNVKLSLEEGFCRKISTKKGWDDNINNFSYTVSALFVSFLIKKYSFKKIKELITSLNKHYYYSDFKKIFFGVYGKELKEVERLFICYNKQQ